MTTKLIRPVRCHFCGQPMYYSGDPLHLPEVRVEVQSDEHESVFYAHVTCWNKIITQITPVS